MMCLRSLNPSSRPAAGLKSAALLVLLVAGGAAAQAPVALVPDHVTPDPAMKAAIDAEWLTDEERKDLRVFHGVWDQRDLDTPQRQAAAALNAWDFDDPALSDPSVPAEIRAEALADRGRLEEAIDLLAGADSNRAARIRAEAYESLGRHEAAAQAVAAPVARLLAGRIDDAAELTEAVRAMIVLARIQGQPARDYQAMMTMLGRASQDLDRLYWPARLTEGRLLVDKDNDQEAVAALHETLALNPRCAEAWFALGRMALDRFDFDAAAAAAQRLRLLNPHHPLADVLLAESRLIQDDPEGAAALLEPLLVRLPQLRPALALAAAADALRYDDEALEAALQRYDRYSPGSARAYFVVGRHLSLNRQYETAAEILNEAIRRQPAWPAPQIELGLMELQSGRDARALAVLEDVVQLDPFNKRAVNSLYLLRELATYEEVESEHFIIRYQPGIDRIVVDLMVEPLERIHRIVCTRFRHEPDRKTVIELAPDHERFAVRITGMPWIHTIAASTGPVIAVEVPRDGPPSKHQGPFDWARVIQHEYTHTVNLSQTRNRIPHWLTEAAAVSMERSPRDYDTCLLLADAYLSGTLFDLDEIKWAFVRPRQPADRALAYAQSHWMVEYMDQRFGESALVRLLGYYFDGVREEEAMLEALGISRAQFFDDFLAWARTQLVDWGLLPSPTLQELQDQLRWSDEALAAVMIASQQARLDAIVRAMTARIGRAAGPRTRGRNEPFTAKRWPDLIRPDVEISDDVLAGWLAEYPDHPDLLLLQIQRRLANGSSDDPSIIELLDRYAAARPVDPYPHMKLAEIRLGGEDPAEAIEDLEQLDRREQKSPVYARKLAALYRSTARLDEAMSKATRAVQISPYDPSNRELAAAIAIEAGRLDLARQHIIALTMLEPGHRLHKKRLEAIEKLIGGG